MIEVQIRRPCSKSMVRYGNSGFWHCRECGNQGVEPDREKHSHKPVYEWLPMEQAIQMAHSEACNEAAK